MRAGKCRLVYVRFAPPTVWHAVCRMPSCRVTAARRCWISAPGANTAAVIWRAFAISRSIPCGRIWRSLTPKSRPLSTARPGCAAILPAASWRSTAFPARTCPAAAAFTASSPQSSWRRAPTPAAWKNKYSRLPAKPRLSFRTGEASCVFPVTQRRQNGEDRKMIPGELSERQKT